MTNRSALEVSSTGSIHCMRKRNTANIILWIAVLVGCFALVQYFVVELYRQVGDEESVRNFQQMLEWGLIYTAFLSFVWWFGAINECQPFAAIRNFFELYSLGCAIAFDVSAVLGILLISLFGAHGIYANNGHFYPLHCVFILPAAFVFLMYAFPPVNIQKVIFPGKRGRWLVAVLAILIAAGLFKIDFF